MAAKRRKITCADAIADILKFVEEDEDEDLNELDSDDDNEGADDMDELYGSDGMFIIYHMKMIQCQFFCICWINLHLFRWR